MQDQQIEAIQLCTHCTLTCCGRSQEFVLFFIIRGANHINLYKNLIKFQIYNAKLGTEGRPLPAPLATPLLLLLQILYCIPHVRVCDTHTASAIRLSLYAAPTPRGAPQAQIRAHAARTNHLQQIDLDQFGDPAAQLQAAPS